MKTKNDNLTLEHITFLKKQRRHKNFIIFIRIGLLFFILGLWEFLTAFNIIDVLFFSSPSRMINTIINLFVTNNLWSHILTTLYEAVLGFVIATGLGYLIAVLLWSNETIRNVLEPYIVVLNSLPKIALGPLIIIWCGIGTKPIVVMAILIIIIVTILSLLNAFLNCDKDKILLLKSFGANKIQILTKIIIPNSMPELISVLKINVGLTWVGTIMGEYLVSKAGLGYLIVYGGAVFKIDLVMASTLILCFLAGGMYFLVVLLEKWHKTKL